jgi:hypothetical protein
MRDEQTRRPDKKADEAHDNPPVREVREEVQDMAWQVL